MKKALLCALCLCLPFALFANGASEESSPAKKTPLTFWEHFETFSAMNADLFKDFTAETGLDVEYTLASPDKMLDSMFVAYRSGTLPDIMSMPMQVSESSHMFSEGWFSPLAVDKSYFSQDIQDQMFDGLSTYKGQVYSFPLFSQNHCALLFYHPSMIKECPKSYEEFYQACKKVYKESNGTVYGLVLPMAFTNRMDETFSYLMDAAGNPIMNWYTGEYQYDSAEMIELFSLLAKMWDEGLIMPSSVNFNMKEARERWAAGEAAFMIDGIWNVGITKNNFMPELDDFAVGDVLTPDGNEDYMVYGNPLGGVYFLSANTKYQKEATKLLLAMVGDEYQAKIANVMDQPPFNVNALKVANVHPSYIEGVQIFTEHMATAPYPALRNPNVLKVSSSMKTITPSPCQILQGYFSGALKDWETALHKYNEQITAERNDAIKKANSKGVEVSLNDWIFPNFVYGENYTSDKYADL